MIDTGNGWIVVRFSHQKTDGMTLIVGSLGDAACEGSAGVSRTVESARGVWGCCTAFVTADPFLVHFCTHLRALLRPPSSTRPSLYESLVYESLVVPKRLLPDLGMRRGSVLCALQVRAFFRQHPHSRTCKTQIICYLPGIPGINKTFPDVLHVPRGTLEEVAAWIDEHRRDPHKIEAIYRTYRFLSNVVWIDRDVRFDVTFSNLGTVPPVRGLEILYKSVQHERSYMNAVVGDTGDIYLSFVHDRDLEGLSRHFLSVIDQIM